MPLVVNHKYRQPDLRFRRPRSNTANGTNGVAGSATVSPKPFPNKRGGAVGEDGDETVRMWLPCFFF